MEKVTEGFVRGSDAFERMNYLYQLSEYWSKTNPNLSAHYAKLMVAISKKSVLRLDRSIKRSVCKGCGVFLSEGETVRSRYAKEHNGQMVCICKRCGVMKRYPCPKDDKKKKS
ncbi:uncharacterized protein Rpp21 [Planococcus citri]|uniref:uncharacterized protein Rpp21 n=1 Tax=Planococcus citri TaxID=170843 RepID=UPI0031F77456